MPLLDTKPHLAAARLAPLAAGAFLALLAALHVVRPDLEPSWHMVSEYAVGSLGWMMTMAFFALASAFVAVLVAVRPYVSGRLGAFALVLLALAACGLVMGGLFPTDPMGTPPDQMTRHGHLHGVSFMIGVPSTLLGITMVNARLWRHSSWRSARFSLGATAAFAWLTLVVFGVSMATFIKGPIGPGFLVGWQNRALVFSWAAWAIATARNARAIGRRETSGSKS